ncbi:disintegrin and metalloproteinase domain-containing protein 10-like, partial [Glossina fuscipes]|uniref:Disintegrin and metalloproteinase domain-containing protein 10-like n=1 Tax=Glossina fuscipes TaxID=7396 RepID=A0A9C6E3T7_9MUSC
SVRLNEYISHYETLNYDHQHIRASHHRARRSVTKDHYVHLKFQAHGRDFHLRLKRDLYTFSDKLEIIDNNNGPLDVATDHIYDGQVIGDRNSYVFGSILDGVFEGKIITERDAYYVEHAKRYFPQNFTQVQHKPQWESMALHSSNSSSTSSSNSSGSGTDNIQDGLNSNNKATTTNTSSASATKKSISDHHDDVIKTIGFHSVIYKDAHVDDMYQQKREEGE